MYEIQLDEARFEATWRICTYLVYNAMLALQITSQRIHKTDPSEYLIFSVVACANLQRRMRELGLHEGAVDAIPSNEDNVPMSRRRIAEATGLPRETVRRTVERLIGRGLLMESEDGYILVPVGIIRGEGYEWAPDVVMGPVVGLMQRLADIGVLRVSPVSAAPAE